MSKRIRKQLKFLVSNACTNAAESIFHLSPNFLLNVVLLFVYRFSSISRVEMHCKLTTTQIFSVKTISFMSNYCCQSRLKLLQILISKLFHDLNCIPFSAYALRSQTHVKYETHALVVFFNAQNR
jgi:hypothetical protein